MIKSCKIFACANGMLGLHLSRAPWDPYPWVSGVQKESNAYRASLRVGDTVLELNGHDILGQKISEIAEQISMHWQNGNSFVTMTIWRSVNETVEGEETEGENQSIINQQSLQKFANCLQNIAQLLECPVCLEVIKPPGWQCCNGHVLCTNCRSRSEKCPVCRVPLGPRGRCLLSDKLFTLLAESFPCDGVRNMKNALKKQHKCTTEFLSTNTTIARERREAKAIRKKVKSLCAANDETSVTTAANPEQAGAVIRWHVEKDYTAGTETVDKNSVDCLHKKMHAAKVLHTPLKTQVDVSEMNKEENSAAILGNMRRTCNKQSTMEKISMSQCSNTYSNNCHNRNNNDNATKLKEVEKVESEESVENIVTNVKLNCCCCCCSFSCNHNAVHDTGNQDEQKMINNNSQNKNNCNNMLVKLKLKSSEKTNVVDAVVSSGSCCCCSSCCHSMSMRSPEKITRSAQSHEQQQQQIRAK